MDDQMLPNTEHTENTEQENVGVPTEPKVSKNAVLVAKFIRPKVLLPIIVACLVIF